MSPTSPDMDLPLWHIVTFKPYNLPEASVVSLLSVCIVFLGFLFACLTLIVCITPASDVFFFFGEKYVFLSLIFVILSLFKNFSKIMSLKYLKFTVLLKNCL